MSEVRRFDLETDPTECGCGYKYMLELPTGEYVLASDYDALAARVAELERAVLILRRNRAPLEKDVPQDVDGFLKWLASPDADGAEHGG